MIGGIDNTLFHCYHDTAIKSRLSTIHLRNCIVSSLKTKENPSDETVYTWRTADLHKEHTNASWMVSYKAKSAYK